MDVPQARERIFFIANNQHYPKLKLNFTGTPIKFGEVRTPRGNPIDENSLTAKRLKKMLPTDQDIGDITARIEKKRNNFNTKLIYDDRVAPTLCANSRYIRVYDKRGATAEDFINVSTFPQDYDFCGNSVIYVTSMCAPPNMMANLATEIYRQWLRK